jgi:hypothetical protein
VTPEEEDQVRRTLGALARQDRAAGLPPAVAERLDRVLDELAAERSHTSAAGTADRSGEPARSPTRHRGWPRVLMAAASVAVVAAAGAVAVDHQLGGGSQSSASRASSADAGAATASSAGPSAGPARGAVGLPVPALRRASLRRDVQRVADSASVAVGNTHALPRPAGSPRAATTSPRTPGPGGSKTPLVRSVLPGCVTPSPRGGGRLVAVRLDGRPATLVLPVGAAPGVTGVARVYACRAPGRPVATTTVRLP